MRALTYWLAVAWLWSIALAVMSVIAYGIWTTPEVRAGFIFSVVFVTFCGSVVAATNRVSRGR